jgi:hypothetical protein
MLLRLLAALFVAQFLLLRILVATWHRLTFEEYFWLGNDFEFLYNGAGLFLSGKSPYLEPNFVPLPPALYLPMALHPLSFWDAFIAFRIITFCLMVGALLWLCREIRLTLVSSALLLLIALTYGPVHTLLAGGNLDGLMLPLLVFACASDARIRGVFLGLSIGTKLYSVLLIPLFLLRRRWREVIWALVTLTILLLPFFRYWPGAFSSAFHRTSALRLNGNESPAVLFILLFGASRVWAWRFCYILLWGGTLVVRYAAGRRFAPRPDQERFAALDYLPWMAAAPVLVFTYTAVILLPVIVLMARENQTRNLRWAEWISVSGFLLTGIYPAMYRPLFEFLSLSPHWNGPLEQWTTMAIAPFGLSAMLVGGSLAPWLCREERLPSQ